MGIINYDQTLFPLCALFAGLLGKCAVHRNAPTFTADSILSAATSSPTNAGAATSAAAAVPGAHTIKRRNHLQRIYTGLFYGPFVPALALFQPWLFVLFLSLMAFMALKEFIFIVAPYR